MLIEFANNILEVLTTLFCIHFFYNEKFKVNYKVIFLISLNIIIYELINTHNLPAFLSYIMYIALITYCATTFERTFREYIINFLLTLVLIPLIQIIVTLPFTVLFSIKFVTISILLPLNLLVLAVLLIIEKYFHLNKISHFFIKHDLLSMVLLFICSSTVLISIFIYHKTTGLPAFWYIGMALFCSTTCTLWYNWITQREKAKERELDLKIYDLYNDPFHELLTELRMRQHDYKNHIQAIYSLHYTCSTFESLVEAQKQYCDSLLESDKYSDLLKINNHILAGFLYGKFSEAARKQIQIVYSINIVQQTYSVPLYIIIEVIGILLNNTIETVENRQDKILYITIDDTETFFIEITNEIDSLPLSEIATFFDKDISSKGPNHGIGLYKVKKYSELYKWNIDIQTKQLTQKTMLSLKIKF